MLKQRLLTALVLIVGAVYAVLALETRWLAWILGVIAVLGGYEWARLITLASPLARIGYALMIAVALALSWMQVLHSAALLPFMALSCLWWLLALVWLGRPQLGTGNKLAVLLLKGGAGLFTLVPAWLTLMVLHAQPLHGSHRLLFLLSLIWVADSAAYFAGKRWGRTKLAPQISPGKTRAGVYGALLAVAVYGLTAANFLGVTEASRAVFVLLCVVTALFSVVGDLFESLFKRQSGMKDSGTLIPGHGGVLDRIDSLTAAAPIFVFGLHWLKL